MCLDKKWKIFINISNAEVTELVDVVDSKSTESNLVGVRVPLSAPKIIKCGSYYCKTFAEKNISFKMFDKKRI